jgi:protein-S-isoprenylcysteine O-methyltransferase Ste14
MHSPHNDGNVTLRDIAHLYHISFIAIRAMLAVRLIGTATVAGCALGASELAAVVVTLIGSKGVPRADGWATVIPLIYLLPLLMNPVGEANHIASVAVMLFAIVQITLRIRMGLCLSVSTPFYRRLITGWPFSEVRHPLYGIEMAMVSAFVIAHTSAWNGTVALVTITGLYVSARIEEQFLRWQTRHSETLTYAEYSKKVRRRFIPKVW